MSQIRLETADELELFLKILAEESVTSAREEIQNISNDPALKTFSQKSQENAISQLKHVHEEVTEEEEEAEADVAAEESEEPDNVESGTPETVSLDTIIDTVKQLRSGRSVDDSAIKSQIRAYYDRLDPQERQVLHTFFDSFSRIISGGASGTDAIDPSQPPLNIQMVKKDEEPQTASQSDTVPKTSDDTESASVEKSEEEVEKVDSEQEGEDITPPIKVGSQQQIAEIRQKIKNLMRN